MQTVLQDNSILKPTIQLFIKAFIIGVLVNLSLQYVAATPLPANDISPSQVEQHSLQQVPASADMQFPDQ